MIFTHGASNQNTLAGQELQIKKTKLDVNFSLFDSII
jgi:hypothetical protein